ncbi:MAG: hypothetical protein AAFV29_03580 [Myxococcota bacterium]
MDASPQTATDSRQAHRSQPSGSAAQLLWVGAQPGPPSAVEHMTEDSGQLPPSRAWHSPTTACKQNDDPRTQLSLPHTKATPVSGVASIVMPASTLESLAPQAAPPSKNIASKRLSNRPRYRLRTATIVESS